MRILVLALLVAVSLSGCATAPHHINDACAIFQQRDGWFNNWYASAKRTERTYGVPVPVLMATIRKESGFRPYARPPRRWILGFIPWKRPSSAYGFSQALNGTWNRYKSETGHWGADRNSFADAIDFVGWYHYQSHLQNGIPLNDTYDLYLAYYFGHTGYARGAWKNNAAVQGAAKGAAQMALSYSAQMRVCGL